jgi:hypothetical protein
MPLVPLDPWTPIPASVWAELRRRYPSTARIMVAMRLAQDAATCADLLAGRPVDPDRVDRSELERAKRRSLVRLVAPIELLLLDEEGTA